MTIKLSYSANDKRLTLLRNHTNITGLLSVCLATLLTYLMSETSQFNHMINWVAILAVLPIVRWLFFYRKIDNNTSVEKSHRRCHAIIIFFLFLSGATWGLGAYFFFPVTANVELFVTFATFMVGITAGLLPSLVASLPGYLAFLLPMMAGIGLRIYQFEQNILLTSVIIYFTYLVVTAFRLNNTVLKAINTDVENERLLTQVKQEKALAHQYAQKTKRLLETKKQLLADVSHELRTPLAVIKIYLEAMEDGIEDEQISYPIVHRKVAQLARLIEDIFLLSKSDLGQLHLRAETIVVDDLLQELMYTFEPLAREHNLSLRFDADLQCNATITGDKQRVTQALSNILQNSINYTDNGGNISAKVSQENSGIAIQIEDSKPSVSLDTIDKLFDRFYRQDESRNRATGGSGLGLSISKQIIAAHHGNISISPSVLGGLSVKVFIPT